MQNLTNAGQTLLRDLSVRYGLSQESAYTLLVAVNNGGGSMAQFSCPELGSGQWMRGGMTMVSDMFNYSLKNTVNNLCGELSHALANQQIFLPAAPGASHSNSWWPGDLGYPSSSGGQNNVRYAVFPQARRLAVQRDNQVSVFDTLDHQIGGVSQQQGSDSSLTFSSQYGTLTTLSLPLVSGAGLQSSAPSNFAAPPPPPSAGPRSVPSGQFLSSSGEGQADLLALLEKLGQLRDAGVLTNEEFNHKKADLLARL